MPRLPVVVVVLACACTEPSPPPLHWQSGATQLVVTEEPFAFEVLGAGGLTRGERDCGALAVALRPDDDDGNRYHRPDDPAPELEWLRAGTLRRTSNGELEVELLDESGQAQGAALLTIGPTADGFVGVDIALPFDDLEVALASVCFRLADGEHVVGGGERFDGVDLKGRVIPLSFNAPGKYASTTNESHAPVPFFATSKGLGVLIETERPGALDVGATQPGALIARFHGNELRLRMRAGQIVENVAALARRGLPPMPPRWALAPMQWRNELDVTVENDLVTKTGQDRLLEDARTLRELDIPTTTLWIDAPWSTGHNTFRFNPVQFPDPEGMLAELDAMGFRVIAWATEHLNFSDDSAQMVGMPAFGSLALFEQFEEAGFLVGNGGGGTFKFPWGRGNGGYVDFTNPGAVAAYQALIRPFVELGVRGFKLDYGEMMRPDLLGAAHNTGVSFSDGSTAETMHTRYARLYHEAFLDVLEEVHPGDWFVITRTGGALDQQNGVTLWPGDLDNDFARAGDVDDEGELAVGGLPAALSGGLSSAMSGYPLYGSDIGGYRGGAPTAESLLRWAQLGAVSVVMQLGGGGTGDTTHNPWDSARYGDDAVAIYRRYARLHMDLLPTLEMLVARAVTSGEPPLVPVGVHMRDDEEAWADLDTFLLGGDLLAAPVAREGAVTRELRLPEGEWLDWWTGELHVGPATVTVDAPLDTLPLFQRAGSVLLLGHPRLESAVGEDERLSTALFARTSPGAHGEARSVDGLVATQETSGGVVEVTLTSPSARLLGVSLPARGDVTAGGASPRAVASEDELYACDEPCALTAGGRVVVVAYDTSLTVRGSLE